MLCFYHQDQEAVGTCKSCGKGICNDCAVDLGKGLACKGRCEADVGKLIELIDRNIQLSPRTMQAVRQMRGGVFAQASFLIVMGGVFLYVAATRNAIASFPGYMGMIFLAYGVYIAWRGFMLPKGS